MKLLTGIFLSAALLLGSGSLALAMSVSEYDAIGSPSNEAVYAVSTTARQITMTKDLNRTMVIKNDDPENAIFYGDSSVTASNGQKLEPGEKTIFQGKSAGFNFYVVTAMGGAELRVVEYP